MNGAIMIDDRIAVRRECAAQRYIRIETTVLIEVNNSQLIGLPHLPCGRLEFAAKKAQECRLAAAVRADHADTHSRLDRQTDSLEEGTALDVAADIFQLDQLLCASLCRGEIDCRRVDAASRTEIRKFTDHLHRGIDARFRLPRPRLGASAQPFDLGMDAVRERLLPLPLRLEILFFGFEESAVAAFNSQESVFIDTGEFDNFRRSVFQKISVVANNNARKRRGLKHGFKPPYSRKIQMVRGFIQQKNIWSLDETFDNRQTLLPAAR